MTHFNDSSKGATQKSVTQNSSQIFRRNRALGYVANHVPALIRYIQRRKDTLVVTCIGRSFQVYTAQHFRLLHVSSVHPDEITAMAINRIYTFTASDKCIYAWRAGKHVKRVFRGHKKNVHLLLPFGTSHLVSVDEANTMIVWHVKKNQIHLQVEFNPDEFLITALMHPSAYLNKVVLGSQQGELKLWNLDKQKLIHTFKHKHNSRVTCIEAAPAADVVAVGHQDGKIYLLNLKCDVILMKFQQDWGSVTNITFRTDGPPIMATASNNGHIAFWNLEDKKIATQVQAHESSVTTAICFPKEALLLTTSPDNSMKLWTFDMSDGGARLLRLREGHTLPPLCIRYHGSTGSTILSAGEDSSLRKFSTISETFNRSFGKASYNRKASKKKNRFEEDTLQMPPIVEFTTEVTREKEWDNIAAIHAGIIQTTTWSFHNNRMGNRRLIPLKFQNKQRQDFQTETTCLTLTHCGNFVIIGYSNGDVERFNIQSGIHRASYGMPAHDVAVRGVASDNLNQIVVSGCSDGFLKFWPFKENVTKCITTIKFNDGISLMRSHRESSMIAVVLVSFVAYVVDADTKTIVRKFEGHTAKVNDATFSPDSRWLITAAMDSTIKVWDIPSSYMIDHFKVERPCVSLSMSPTGDFLATAHVNYLGIYLWANKVLFNQISLRSINPYEKALYVGLPSNIADDVDDIEGAMQDLEMDVDNDYDDDDDDDDDERNENYKSDLVDFKYETPAQLSDKLITMSGLAASRWQNLLDLELIKKRNKPKAPPKVPKQAPFFLPTVAGLEMKFDISSEPLENEKSRVLKPTNFSNFTKFGKILEETTKSNDYTLCVEHLKQLGPSMIDFEIKSLHPFGGGSYTLMVQFLNTIEYMFSTNSNFELAQSYLSAFLRAHGLNLLESESIVEAMKRVSTAQEESWRKVEEKMIYGIGVVSALRNFTN